MFTFSFPERPPLDEYNKKIISGIAIGLVPILLAAPTLLQPGYPFGGEIYSNLVPAIHARDALAAGQFPWDAPWFSGRNIWINPLFKGAYPFAWPLYMPFVPLAVAVKFVVAIHLFGTVFVSFWILEKDIGPVSAGAMALLFLSPIAVQVGVAHLEKLFAWPWVVLAATQTVPWRLQKSPDQAGLVIGVCIGMALLAGGNYYAAYIYSETEILIHFWWINCFECRPDC